MKLEWAITLGALLTGASASASVARAQANGTERDDILGVVQRMFDGMRQKDTAQVRAVFHPSARLVGMRPAAGGGAQVQVLSVDQWVAFIGRDLRPDWTERAWNPEVKVEGTLATVWAAYDFHFGTTFSHCGVDAVQLLRTDAGWRIMSIADTYQPSGCRRRPPPEMEGGDTTVASRVAVAQTLWSTPDGAR